MRYAFKKIFLAVAALTMTAFSQTQVEGAYAPVFEGNNTWSENNCCQPICEPACCPTPCGTWFVDASLLYWRVYEGGLVCNCSPNEITDTVDSNGHTNSVLRSKNNELSFDWDLGYRVGIGYDFACSNWGIGAYYTHFHDRAHGHHHNENSFTHFKFNYDEVDVLASYSCEVCPCFYAIPFFGVRGTWIDQRLRSRFSTEIVTDLSDSFTVSGHHDKEDFWGVGPVLGLEGDWLIGCGFSVYGYVDTAVLYGNFHTKFNDFEDLTDVSSICNSNEDRSAALYVGDFGLGVGWTKCWCNSLITLQIGWEHDHYFDFNQIGSGGDLSLDGVNFSAGISY